LVLLLLLPLLGVVVVVLQLPLVGIYDVGGKGDNVNSRFLLGSGVREEQDDDNDDDDDEKKEMMIMMMMTWNRCCCCCWPCDYTSFVRKRKSCIIIATAVDGLSGALTNFMSDAILVR
jgi:hypothetical protein